MAALAEPDEEKATPMNWFRQRVRGANRDRYAFPA